MKGELGLVVHVQLTRRGLPEVQRTGSAFHAWSRPVFVRPDSQPVAQAENTKEATAARRWGGLVRVPMSALVEDETHLSIMLIGLVIQDFPKGA